MKKDRILNLWCDDLVKPLSRLSSEERDILVSFPTIFAIDQGPNGHKNGDLAYYGFIRKITVLGDSVKIFFEIISSFSQKELYKNVNVNIKMYKSDKIKMYNYSKLT